jgi:hypothetical protein
VYTEEEYPADWAGTQVNLGAAYAIFRVATEARRAGASEAALRPSKA